jgi:archaellum component FlaC
MSDIVEQLDDGPGSIAALLREKDDEIERLQAQLNGCRLACDLATNELEVLRPKIERLRAENDLLCSEIAQYAHLWRP